MLRRVLLAVLLVTFTISGLNFAQYSEPEEETEMVLSKETKKEVIKGTVKEIAEDSSYIIVDETKILTSNEFLYESFMAIGDVVEITVEKTDKGLKTVDYRYIFEEETQPSQFEERASSENDFGETW